MANQNAPAGLVPVSHINGGNWNGKTNRYFIAPSDTNVYAVGDVVVSTPGAGQGYIAAGLVVDGVPQITKAGLSSNPRGVIVSVEQDRNGNAERVIPATKLRGYVVNVADDPLLVFQVQANNTTALPLTSINKYADLVLGTPSGGQGVSGTMLDVATIGLSTNTLRVLGLANGDFSTNAQLLVCFNFHELG